MGLNFILNYGNIITIFVITFIIIEQTTANQLEIAKKYGKRFGNKNKANTTESKEIDKSIAKSIDSEVTKAPKVLSVTTSPSTTRQKYSYSKLHTTTTTSPSTTPESTTVATKVDDQEEVDVDLSQLQVSLPNVKFDCSSRSEGYYGDPDYRCEVFHYCSSDGKRDTFLCPSNSKFNQKDMTCDTDALDDLCQSDPVWGHNHLYPTTVPTISHVSPHELNLNQNNKNNREKVQIEVTAPKYETKENGFREPVYDIKSLDNNQRKANSNTKTSANHSEGNSDDKNNYSNNESKDNNKNIDNNNNGKDIKFNYFGGNFGERQKNPGSDDDYGADNIAGAANDRKNSQTNYNNNNYNINNNNDKNTQHLNSDFGTVSDANKKGYKEYNGNSNRVTSHQPVLSHSTTDSYQYSTNGNKQSFTPNNSQRVNSIRNNNKNGYESTRSEPYIPSTEADKSYLMPPPLPTVKTSSVAPPKQYTSSRHKTQEQPVRQLAPILPTRPAVKWPNKKQNTDSYVTERTRTDVVSTLPPSPMPTTYPPQHYRPPVITLGYTELLDRQKDPWPQLENNAYDTQFMTGGQTGGQPTQNPKPIQSEHTDIQHNWSTQIHNAFTSNQQNPNQLNVKHTTKAPVYKNWNNLDLQQKMPEPEHYYLNKDPVYTYPGVHHTIGPSSNHLWSDEKTPQPEDNNKPNKELNTMSAQSLKPKWAQELSEMEVIPHYQTLGAQTQQIIPQSSQPQRTHSYSKDMLDSSRRIATKPSSGQTGSVGPSFGQSGVNGFEFTVRDYYDIKPSYSYEGHQPIARPQQMNYFYDQFKPYNFAENNPTEYVKKLTQNEKELIKQSLLSDENKNNKNILNNNNNFQLTPTLIEEMKSNEKELSGTKMAGYVPEIIADEEYPLTLPETHFIPKLHKMNSMNKMKQNFAKYNPNRYKPSKHHFVTTSNFFDELMAGENGWALKPMEGLETAFSHTYPVMPLTLPNRRPKVPKVSKNGYSMITHLTAPNRLVLPSPLAPPRPPSQPAFFIQHQLPFAHQIQAQSSMPFQYYLPFLPTAQQTSKPKKKQTKMRSKPKVIRI